LDIHRNARLTAYSRAESVRRAIEERQTPKAVATALGGAIDVTSEIGVGSRFVVRLPDTLTAA